MIEPYSTTITIKTIETQEYVFVEQELKYYEKHDTTMIANGWTEDFYEEYYYTGEKEKLQAIRVIYKHESYISK